MTALGTEVNSAWNIEGQGRSRVAADEGRGEQESGRS